MNRALTDLLRAHARGRPGVTLDSLRRQFAYDRLLTRIFTGPDAKRWILKGATAILARLAGDARHTRDIDLYRQDEDLPAAENSLRTSAATDAGDFFRFTLDPGQRITQERRDNPRLADRDVTQALRTAAALLDPALAMTAAGTWDSVRRFWSER
jgi:nucleotidyltransferase AbiEii toxin of type IV toxin-antitoxin system